MDLEQTLWIANTLMVANGMTLLTYEEVPRAKL